MIKFKQFLFIAFLLIIAVTDLHAQQVIPAAGGNATGTGGKASYSIGQIVYPTNKGKNGSVGQGVQQPYEISVVSGIDDAKGNTIRCSVYPNPAGEYLILKIEDEVFSRYTSFLYDIDGKLILVNNIKGSVTRIDMSNMVKASYFLRIVKTQPAQSSFKHGQNSAGQEFLTFKVIKK